MIKYLSEALRLHGSTNPPKRGIRKRLFKLGIWSCRSKYTSISATPESHVENTQLQMNRRMLAARLLDLSSAFNTIDHSNLFTVLKTCWNV